MNPLVIISSGGCSEAIDGVRSISNFSTGRTGAHIADYFFTRGWDVILVKNSSAANPENRAVSVKEFTSFSDLQNCFRKLAKEKRQAAAVISAAAVSDYGVDCINVGDTSYKPDDLAKMTGEITQNKKVTIVLKEHPKLIDEIRDLFPEAQLVGFKLTNKADTNTAKKAVESLFTHSKAEIIVHNDLSAINGRKHHFAIYSSDPLQLINKGESREEMAQVLYDILQKGREGEDV